MWEEKAFLPIYRRLSRARAKHPALAAVRSMYGNTIETHDRLAPLAKEKTPPPPPVAYPDSDLGKAFGNLGRLLGAGFGTRVATISQRRLRHARRPGRRRTPTCSPTSATRCAPGRPTSTPAALSDRVLTLIWSEFGRRPEDNDSGGTDHGAGGLLLLVGNRANGGVRSEFPGLTRLDDDENLIVTTDFRTVYATLLESWLGVEAGRVLPQTPGRPPLCRCCARPDAARSALGLPRA